MEDDITKLKRTDKALQESEIKFNVRIRAILSQFSKTSPSANELKKRCVNHVKSLKGLSIQYQ
jgi:hypothetical protein